MADNFNIKQFLMENKLGAYSRVKEDLGKDLEDTEAEREMDFLDEKEVEESISIKSVQKAEMALQNILKNIATNSNIPTDEKEGLINALGELQDFVDEVGYDSEMGEDEYVSDYSRRRASELNEDETKEPIKEGGDIFADIDDDIAYGSDSKEDTIEYLEEIIDYCQKKIVELENEQGYEDEDDLGEAMGGKNPEGDKLVLRFLQGVAKKFDYPVSQAARFVKDTIKSLGY